MSRGLYDAFDIDLPFTDASINPLDTFSSSDPGSSPGSRNVLAKPFQSHHIATDKHPRFTPEFEELFKHANEMSLNDPDNRIDVEHGGRHPKGYHKFILNRLRVAVGDLRGDAAEAALRAE